LVDERRALRACNSNLVQGVREVVSVVHHAMHVLPRQDKSRLRRKLAQNLVVESLLNWRSAHKLMACDLKRCRHLGCAGLRRKHRARYVFMISVIRVEVLKHAFFEFFKSSDAILALSSMPCSNLFKALISANDLT